MTCVRVCGFWAAKRDGLSVPLAGSDGPRRSWLDRPGAGRYAQPSDRAARGGCGESHLLNVGFPVLALHAEGKARRATRRVCKKNVQVHFCVIAHPHANPMMKAIALSLALLAVAGAKELTPDTWESETAGKTVFIKFQAPW